MKSVNETARRPFGRDGQPFLLTGLVSVCMAAIGCGECLTSDSQLSERKSIPHTLPTSKLIQPSPAGDGTVAWRGVDSGYRHVINGN